MRRDELENEPPGRVNKIPVTIAQLRAESRTKWIRCISVSAPRRSELPGRKPRHMIRQELFDYKRAARLAPTSVDSDRRESRS